MPFDWQGFKRLFVRFYLVGVGWQFLVFAQTAWDTYARFGRLDSFSSGHPFDPFAGWQIYLLHSVSSFVGAIGHMALGAAGLAAAIVILREERRMRRTRPEERRQQRRLRAREEV